MKFQKVTRIVLVLCVTLIATVTYAQPGGGQRGGSNQGGPPPIPTDEEIETMVSELADEIELDELQEASVLELYKEHFAAVESKTKSGRPKREEIEALQTAFENEVKEILTEDQQKLYTAYQKKNRSKGKKQQRK